MAKFLCNYVRQHVGKALVAASLLAGSFAQAQGPVAGYDYLGACGGHNYYISQDFVFGNQISTKVADFQAKTPVPDNQVYAAAIVNATENTCITNLMLAYNTTKYGTPKTTGQNWRDPHNAWIGLTDAAQEGNFVWANGQLNCQNYRNWNVGEPNNFAGSVSNGEDYTQILLMEPYAYGTGTNDPLGKWNDWFNQNIMDGTTNLGPTTLPVIIEVGAADCQPVTRGNKGCSHGYYKKGPEKPWTDAGFKRTDKFMTTFGITNSRGIVTANTTLDGSLDLKGGGYAQVAKQGTAALLNAGHGFYPYTVSEIKNAVGSMFNTGTAMLPSVTVNGTTYTGGTFTSPEALASYLDRLNNLDCPLDNAGNMSTSTTSRTSEIVDENSARAFAVSGYPNPSNTGFSIQIAGASNEMANIKVTDLNGRVIEQRSNIAANQVLKIGANYRAGMYYVEVSQGANKKQLKLVKQ